MNELNKRIKSDFNKSGVKDEFLYGYLWMKVYGFEEANKYLKLKWIGK